MLINNPNIFKISNNYILKSVFSYLDYRYILKLVKNNRAIQKRLDIDLNKYKKISDFPLYEYIKEKKIIGKRKGFEQLGNDVIILVIAFVNSIFFTYLLIYSILLVSLNTFDDNNTKENYNKSYLNIIKTFNKYLFIVDGIVVLYFFLYVFYLFKNCQYDFGIKKIIKKIILIIIDIIHFLFEGLIIWKLALSYKIKNSGITWFMTLDYIFIILNFFHILYLLLLTYWYFRESGSLIKIITKCSLISYENIKIDKFELPDNFENFSKKQRKKYVSDNNYTFKYSISEEQVNLINSINIFREEKDIPKLGVDYYNKIPNNLFNNLPAEIILNPHQNIFKLSNKNYIFRYAIGEFGNKFINKDLDILNILLKDNLNHIQIITQENNEFIFISELISYHYKTTKIELYESSVNSDDYFSLKSEKKFHELNIQNDSYIE